MKRAKKTTKPRHVSSTAYGASDGIVGGKRYLVVLTPDLARILRHLGQGNLSAGIRRAAVDAGDWRA